MIRKLTKTDQESVLAFLYEEPEINLYIIGDIKNFGFDQDDLTLYAEFRDGQYHAVLSRHLSHLVYYASNRDFNADWLDIIGAEDFLFLSGKASLIKPLANHFPECFVDRLDFMKTTTFTKDDSLEDEGITYLETEHDAEAVYKLLNSIEELSSVQKKSKEEFIQYLMENSGDNGTTVFIKDGEHVIASASAVGETKRTAMVVGVATHPDYRKQGLGKKVLVHLVNLYVNQKHKTLCLYYDDPRAKNLYEQLGFVSIEDWIMLVKKHG